MADQERKRLDIMDASDADNDRNADWIKEARRIHQENMRLQELAETGRQDHWDALQAQESQDEY